jgi:hypothetical protein
MFDYAATVLTKTPGLYFPMLIWVPPGEDVEERVTTVARITAKVLLIAGRIERDA